MSVLLLNLVRELRYALRQLRRSPGFTLAVVATLAVGVGLNTAVFTVVDAVLLRPLGYHDADRIVALRTSLPQTAHAFPRMGGDDYADMAREIKGFEATAYYSTPGPDGLEWNGTAFYLPVVSVSPQFGAVLGVAPIAGRLFNPHDTEGNDALVSAGFAREHFGSAAASLGQALRYNGLLHPIVGVLPDGFSFPGKTAVWFETSSRPAWGVRSAYNQMAIGRLRAGVTAAQLGAELATFSTDLQRAYPEDRGKVIDAVPLQEQIVGSIRPTLRLLMASVALVLLIVAVNVTHLQLVRSTRQLRSVTIRSALGATRASLAWRAICEAGLLAVAGMAAALLLAVPALRLLLRLAPPELPRLEEVRLQGAVLLFSFLASAVVMMAAALLPVWRSWHLNPAFALRQDAARGTEDRGALRLRRGLVVAEVALTLMLSAGAVLLARQLVTQSRQDLGFAADRLLVIDAHAVSSKPPVAAPAADAPPAALAAWSAADRARGERQLQRVESALSAVAATPGVQAATAVQGAPMSMGHTDVSFAVRGRQSFTSGAEHLPQAYTYPVTPSFFDTLQMRLLHGRLLSAEDRAGAPLVVVINETLAKQIFPGEDPIGREIACGYDDPAAPWWKIVGVVADIRDSSPAEAPFATFYVPLAQHPSRAGDVQLVARSALDPGVLTETLRQRLHRAYPDIAVHATTMRDSIGIAQQTERFRTALFAGFAAVSILLAAIGLYGVTAYTVAQRRFEFGLRIALGASRGRVLGSVLRSALVLAAAGVAIGVVLSLSLTRLLASVVGSLPAFDATTYTVAAALVLLLALAATVLPANAAAATDPMHVLRNE